MDDRLDAPPDPEADVNLRWVHVVRLISHCLTGMSTPPENVPAGNMRTAKTQISLHLTRSLNTAFTPCSQSQCIL